MTFSDHHQDAPPVRPGPAAAGVTTKDPSRPDTRPAALGKPLTIRTDREAATATLVSLRAEITRLSASPDADRWHLTDLERMADHLANALRPRPNEKERK